MWIVIRWGGTVCAPTRIFIAICPAVLGHYRYYNCNRRRRDNQRRPSDAPLTPPLLPGFYQCERILPPHFGHLFHQVRIGFFIDGSSIHNHVIVHDGSFCEAVHRACRQLDHFATVDGCSIRSIFFYRYRRPLGKGTSIAGGQRVVGQSPLQRIGRLPRAVGKDRVGSRNREGEGPGDAIGGSLADRARAPARKSGRSHGPVGGKVCVQKAGRAAGTSGRCRPLIAVGNGRNTVVVVAIDRMLHMLKLQRRLVHIRSIIHRILNFLGNEPNGWDYRAPGG
mmetsp:Transcript_31170/g.91315  ORF Transcript_31170/g.91315 Transcript_31170/m.91315 type:complete len:280 (+) Transcript_31170:1188-2027(+)